MLATCVHTVRIIQLRQLSLVILHFPSELHAGVTFDTPAFVHYPLF